jgi:hypothetical protein
VNALLNPGAGVQIWWRGERQNGHLCPALVLAVEPHGIWVEAKWESEPRQFYPFAECRIGLLTPGPLRAEAPAELERGAVVCFSGDVTKYVVESITPFGLWVRFDTTDYDRDHPEKRVPTPMPQFHGFATSQFIVIKPAPAGAV